MSSTDFISTTVTGPEWVNNSGLQRVVNDEFNKALRKSLTEGKKILRREIEESNAVASKTLLNSVTSKYTNAVSDSWIFAGDIFFRSPADRYATFADKGRGAGGVPPSAQILSWMRTKGIDEKYLWPIMLTLAKKGTQTNFWNLWDRTPFIESATNKIDAKVKAEFEEAAERIRIRLENARTTSISTSN